MVKLMDQHVTQKPISRMSRTQVSAKQRSKSALTTQNVERDHTAKNQLVELSPENARPL